MRVVPPPFGSCGSPPRPSPVSLTFCPYSQSNPTIRDKTHFSLWITAVENCESCAQPGDAAWHRPRPASSDVQEAHVLGVALDEGATGVHVLAHEHAEELVGRR